MYGSSLRQARERGLLTLLIAASLPCLPATAVDFDGPVPRIVNGTLTTAHPAAGALLSLTNPQNPDAFRSEVRCSGILIGCSTFLTAAHCVCDTIGADCQEGGNGFSAEPSAYRVFFQHAGLFAVSEILVHPDYDFGVAADVALLKLSTPLDGIAPAPINTTATPQLGTSATIVGFGRSGGSAASNADSGLKRMGRVTVSACANVPEAAFVCWRFANPLGSPGTNSNTCEGDSGGPLLIDSGSTQAVAGVTSGGDSLTCLPLDESFDADVFENRDWIESAAGDDLSSTACGGLPQVGQAGAVTSALSGELNEQTQSVEFTIDVPPGTALLRVALNGDESDDADFDVFINAGSRPTAEDFDCGSARNSQFDFCAVNAPASGTWHILVQRFAGAGVFQVTATVFSSGPVGPTPTPTPTPIRRAQSKDQQKCINAMNRDGAKVAAAQGHVNAACVADAGKGKVADVAACLTADAKGKVAKATAGTAEDERDQCRATPDFGFAGSEGVNDAATGQSLALFADVFGDDPDEAIVSCSQDRSGCRCQAAVVRDYEKILATKLKEFLKCKKTALKDGADAAAALESCLTPGGIAADSGGRIAKQIDKLAADIGSKCSANVFPGACAGSDLAALPGCIDERVECRACRMIDAMDALAVDCDLFDDGVNDDSCGAGGSPAPSPTPSPTPTIPVGQIACGQTVSGELTTTDPDLFGDGTFADLYVFTLTQPQTVRFTLTAGGFVPYLWVGGVDSQTPIFSGSSPQAGALTAGVYNVVANNSIPVAPGVYPYELAMTCTSN